jgi:hypothetical protein
MELARVKDLYFNIKAGYIYGFLCIWTEVMQASNKYEKFKLMIF